MSTLVGIRDLPATCDVEILGVGPLMVALWASLERHPSFNIVGLTCSAPRTTSLVGFDPLPCEREKRV